MKPWLIIGAVVVGGAGIFGLVRLHQKTIRLEADLAGLKHSTAGQGEADEREKLREENRRLATLLAQTRRGEGKSPEAIHAELEKTRSELVVLERRAQESAADAAHRAAVAEENRDPEKGMARLEYFQNVGRATPAAALQTIGWAAIKGENATLVAALSLTDAARQKATDFLAGLSEEARRRYPTAESLAALEATGEIVDVAAVKITGCTYTDSQHATLNVLRLQAADQAMRIQMELGAEGWRMVVSDRVIDSLKQRMSESGSPPKKKN
jgi:hypothetical protein